MRSIELAPRSRILQGRLTLPSFPGPFSNAHGLSSGGPWPHLFPIYRWGPASIITAVLPSRTLSRVASPAGTLDDFHSQVPSGCIR